MSSWNEKPQQKPKQNNPHCSPGPMQTSLDYPVNEKVLCSQKPQRVWEPLLYGAAQRARRRDCSKCRSYDPECNDPCGRHRHLTLIEYNKLFAPPRYDGETWHDRREHFFLIHALVKYDSAVKTARESDNWNHYCKRSGIRNTHQDGFQTSCWQPTSTGESALVTWNEQESSIEVNRRARFKLRGERANHPPAYDPGVAYEPIVRSYMRNGQLPSTSH
jgi:hypothetical protein